MSLKKQASERKSNGSHSKSSRYRCLSFSFVDSASVDGKKKPSSLKDLKRMDSKKVKAEIVKWAKRVAAYARQLSSRKRD
ncbi:unnamed protein product [Microthlaspi erraticum]|uniref:Uncharacterized protein n=1 Tax=Microthlaspi erraticum TaxID=1685480 RepID=A0A6D2KCJ2_9BRAS|nr:unnamed protein product [Microthlaspi erraticum]